MAFRDAFPIFHTADLPRAVAFYREHLRFQERYRFPDEGKSSFVLVGLGSFSLGLTLVAEVDPPGRASLWLYCDDVDDEVTRLREAGVSVVSEPTDEEWGERVATVVDPDGNQIYIGQRGAT